jgi:hypothetical protein
MMSIRSDFVILVLPFVIGADPKRIGFPQHYCA